MSKMTGSLIILSLLLIPKITCCQDAELECEFKELKGGQIDCTNPDVLPSPKGGMEMIYTSLYQSIKYPSVARDSVFGSNTIIKFVVDQFGKIKNKEVVREDMIGLDLPKQMFNVIETLIWLPGTCCGTSVAVEFYLPMKICLQ